MTPSASARALAEEIAAAHGGHEQWRRYGAVDVRFSAGGLAFLSKGQSETLSDVAGRLGTAAQSVGLQGQRPHPWSYEVEGGALRSEVARLVSNRRLLWTTSDAAAFAAMAMWTYLNLPFLILDPSVGLELLPRNERELRRLRVRIPSEVATHSPVQILHIDASGIIRRHDYTARAIGRWATGSQLLEDFEEFDGILFATKRTVTPRVGGIRLPGPELVRIKVDGLRFVAGERS